MNPAPGLSIEQQPSGALHRMQMFGEARGERDSGGTLESVAMLAVGFVPLNRLARKRWSKLVLRTVLLEKWAFSCFNENDPNRALLLEAPKVDPISWERADTIADLIESGMVKDPSGNATHYCTLKLWGMETPPGRGVQWYHRSEIESGRTHETARFGSHVFAIAP